ncbi:MAG: hypothetical protein AAF809_14745, partial [Bacteroidota bacterium]
MASRARRHAPRRFRTDFAEAQREAARQSAVLFVLFLGATVFLIGAYATFMVLGARAVLGEAPSPMLAGSFGLGLLVLMAVSGVRTYRRYDDPAALLDTLGARPLRADRADERQFRNVAEEVAVAACVPVPSLYVFDRGLGVNAVALGTLDHGAVAFTAAAVQGLDRDAMQALAAHQIGLLASGDARLHRRTAALLSALTLEAGRDALAAGLRALVMPRPASPDADDRPRESASTGLSDGMYALMLVGVALLLPLFYAFVWALSVAVVLAGLALVPLLGLALAPLLAHAAARQRAFRADALAIALTRYPAGLAAVLRSIEGSVTRGHAGLPRGRAIGAFFFTRPDTEPVLFRWLGPHPPIAERLRRVETDFDGVVENVSVDSLLRSPYETSAYGAPVEASPAPRPEIVEGLVAAALLLDTIPAAVRAQARDLYRAPALLLATLLPEHGDDNEALATIRSHLPDSLPGPDFVAQVAGLLPQVRHCSGAERLALAEIAMPAVQQLPLAAQAMLTRIALAVMRLDQVVSPVEYAILQVLRYGTTPGSPPSRSLPATQQRRAGGTVLAWAAHHGHARSDQAKAAYQRARASHLEAFPAELPDRPAWAAVDTALDLLRAAPLATRGLVMEAAQQCIAYDGVVTDAEAVVVRALALALGVPAVAPAPQV